METGKKVPKRKSSKTVQQCNKDGHDLGAKIPAEKPTAKTKKSAKLASSTDTEEEEPVSSVKNKPLKIKFPFKAGGCASTGLSSAKPKKPDEGRSTIKNKKRVKERDHVAEVQNHTEPTTDSAEQPEVQSPSAGMAIMIEFTLNLNVFTNIVCYFW